MLRRFHAAHLDRLYRVAIADVRQGRESSFFRLSDERHRQHGQIPVRRSHKGYGSSSAVMDRLVDLPFLDPQECAQITKDQCRKRLQLNQQDGKHYPPPDAKHGLQDILLSVAPNHGQ